MSLRGSRLGPVILSEFMLSMSKHRRTWNLARCSPKTICRKWPALPAAQSLCRCPL